ncbi:MAG: hypothetical protein ACXACE_14760 [Candidatus Thorarchaeota archaeon]
MNKISKRGRSSNDDRSDSKNPNNPAYQASVDNRADQLNLDHEAYHSSREETDEDDEE